MICMHHDIEAVDRTSKNMMCSNIAFGGEDMLFLSDF